MIGSYGARRFRPVILPGAYVEDIPEVDIDDAQAARLRESRRHVRRHRHTHEGDADSALPPGHQSLNFAIVDLSVLGLDPLIGRRFLVCASGRALRRWTGVLRDGLPASVGIGSNRGSGSIDGASLCERIVLAACLGLAGSRGRDGQAAGFIPETAISPRKSLCSIFSLAWMPAFILSSSPATRSLERLQFAEAFFDRDEIAGGAIGADCSRQIEERQRSRGKQDEQRRRGIGLG